MNNLTLSVHTLLIYNPSTLPPSPTHSSQFTYSHSSHLSLYSFTLLLMEDSSLPLLSHTLHSSHIHIHLPTPPFIPTSPPLPLLCSSFFFPHTLHSLHTHAHPSHLLLNSIWTCIGSKSRLNLINVLTTMYYLLYMMKLTCLQVFKRMHASIITCVNS